MKKIFLIIILFLLPLQYTWAMVASYDTHDAQDHDTQDTEIHFGHHEHYSDVLTSDANSNQPDSQDAENLNSHLHLGFFHLSCGELNGNVIPQFEQLTVHNITPYLFVYHSPPTFQPERPNWLLAV